MFSFLKKLIAFRKNANALTITNQRLEAIMNGSSHMIISTDMNGIITVFNKAAEQTLGYSAQEMIGKCTPEIFHDPEEVKMRTKLISKTLGKDITAGFQTFVAFLTLESVNEQEWIYITKDQHKIPVLLTITSLYKDKEIIGYMGMAQDITERKKIETLKDEFVSIVSHELRTPLTSIQGSLSLLLGGAVTDLPDPAKQLLQIAKQNSERLNNLINDILDAEKISSESHKFDLFPIEINQVIDEAVAINQPYADQFSAKLIFTRTTENLKVEADQGRLLQVLTNLISNAAKFSPPGSAINIAANLKNDQVVVTVHDQGAGIPIEFRDKIFDRFSQADSSPTRKKSGTGLGLHIAKTIIEKLNGKIGLKSTLGQGTEFYFELPCINNSHKYTAKVIRHPARLSVLVYTKDEKLVASLNHLFNQHNIDLFLSNNIKLTKKLLTGSKENDLLLLDLNSSGEEGIELIQTIRSWGNKFINLPIVAICSKKINDSDEYNLNSLNIIDWIEKSNDLPRILSAIQTIKYKIKKIPTIIHIENDQDITTLITTFLQRDADIISCTSLEAGKNILSTHHYDAAILDLKLPDGFSFDLLPELSSKHIPVIIFSSYECPKESLHHVYKAFLKSQTSPEELLSAIKSAIRISHYK